LAVERRKAAKRYLVVLYVSFAINTLKTIVLIPLFLAYIQPRLYGAWLATGDVIAALGLLEFGMGRVLVQKIAAALGRKDNDGLSELIGTGAFIYAVIGILPLLVGLATAAFLPGFVQIHGHEARTLSIAFIIAAAAASLMLSSNAVAAVLIGLQDQVTVSVIGVLGLAAGIGATVSLLLTGHGLNSIPLGSVVQAVVGFVGGITVAALTLRKSLPELRLRISRPLLTMLLKDTGILFVGSALFVIVARCQNPLIAHLYDPGLCNVYTFTFLLQTTLAGMVAYISHALVPGLAHLVGESGEGKVRDIVASLIKVSLMFSGLLMGGVFFLNEEFVHLWVGSEYFGGPVLNGLACVNGIGLALFVGLQNVILSCGAFSAVSKGNVLKSVINLLLLVPLALLWGLEGIAAASVVSLVLGIFLVQSPFLSATFGAERRSLFGSWLRPAVTVSVPFLIGFVLKAMYSPHGVTSFVCAGTLYTALTLLFFCLIDREARAVLLETIPAYCTGYLRR
jgi:O-antigen/teichoic acid export membrane protein